MSFLPTTIFSLPGIIASIVTLATIDFLLPYIRPSKLHRYLHTQDGKPAWALVTGASDGIGKALSHELAAQGFNVVLHGRNPAKLERLQREFESAHPGRSFRTLVADATQFTPDTFKDIANRLADVHLTVLINNAGGTPTTGEPFKGLDEYSNKEVADTVNLNAVFPSMMLNALLPGLGGKGPGLAITIGSLAANGLPYVAAYGASKSFLKTLCTAVDGEMRLAGRDVEVMWMGVGQVTGVAGLWVPASLFVPHATTAAKAILGRVGCGRVAVVPYWPHGLQMGAMGLVPTGLKAMIMRKTMAQLKREGLNPGQEKKE